MAFFVKWLFMQSLVECKPRTYRHYARSERRFPSLRRESPARWSPLYWSLWFLGCESQKSAMQIHKSRLKRSIKFSNQSPLGVSGFPVRSRQIVRWVLRLLLAVATFTGIPRSPFIPLGLTGTPPLADLRRREDSPPCTDFGPLLPIHGQRMWRGFPLRKWARGNVTQSRLSWRPMR